MGRNARGRYIDSTDRPYALRTSTPYQTTTSTISPPHPNDNPHSQPIKVKQDHTTRFTTNLEMKLLPLTLLLSAAGSVLADKTIIYTCSYPLNGSSKHSVKESKHGDAVSDDFADRLIRSMLAWSDQRYLAKSDGIRGMYAVVACRVKAEYKEQALEAIEEQESIVKKQLRREKGESVSG